MRTYQSVLDFAKFVSREDIRGLTYPMLYNYYQMYCKWRGVPDEGVCSYKNFGTNMRQAMPMFLMAVKRDGTAVAKRVAFRDEDTYAVGLTPGYIQMQKKLEEIAHGR